MEKDRVGEYTSRLHVPPAYAGPAHAAVRIGTGLLFLQHGLQKLFGLFGGTGLPDGTVPALTTLMGVAGLLELLGGSLLVIGLFTRPTALVLMFEMLSAYVMSHAPRGSWPILNGGELALLYALVFLWLATHGAGPASADAARRAARLDIADARRVRALAESTPHFVP